MSFFSQDLSAALSRRDFLKLGGLTLGGLLLPPFLQHREDSLDFLGRVLEPNIQVFDRPSTSGKVVKTYWRDLVIPISNITIGEDQTAYNRVWYRIAEEGYAYSGAIQPVEVNLNQPNTDIPADGRLGEITVPFTDARWKPAKDEGVSYRLYYGTTHWVTGLVKDDSGGSWYRILDDKWKYSYYAPAEHVRLVMADELATQSPKVPLEGKRIDVSLKDQVLIAYEWDKAVFMTRIASGARFSTGNYETPAGTHIVNWKRPYRHMAAGDRAAPNSYDLPGVPWVCYFTADGVSIHGTYWHNDFGKPRSHGCINLSIPAARWIYLWTMPPVPPEKESVFEDYGTRVDILA
jgi:hypothetical protein